MKIESFKELIVWQRAIELVKEIYQATNRLPLSERYGIVSQMRRAVVSIPSNIAEGHRRGTRKDFTQFLRIADGSSSELETQIIIASDLYSQADFSKLADLLKEVQRMLGTIIKKLNSQP